MGSTRLPGKVMLPLAGDHVLARDIRRVAVAETLDDVVVATSNKKADDIVAQYAKREGATVYRGDEKDVLERILRAAMQASADRIVRITGDCPLVSPSVIDSVVRRHSEAEAEYCSNVLKRTFPRGLDVEVVSGTSLKSVESIATESRYREHVTLYYHDNPSQFALANITSDEVFDEPWMQDRTDLRLTLDEADDYEVLREIYDNVPFDDIVDVKDAIRYVDEHDLMEINENVAQKT
jgi:spore coat polysaccharide biosynthesis protein SpsF